MMTRPLISRTSPILAIVVCVLTNRATAQVTDNETGITPKEQLGLTFQGGGQQTLASTGVGQGAQTAVSLTPAERQVIHQADVRHARTPVVEGGRGWDAVWLYGPNAKPAR